MNPGTGYSIQPEQRALAINWFNNGQFDRALPVFSALTYNFPSDLLLKYYHGACLIETGNYISESEKNLILASTGEVPAKVYYYLGRYYHATGDWNNAQRFYNRFKNFSTTAEIRELRIDELSQLCYSQINPFSPVSATTQPVTNAQENSTVRDTSLDSGKTFKPPVAEPVNNTDSPRENIPSENQSGFQQVKNMPDSVRPDSPVPAVIPGDISTQSESTTVILPVFIEFQITDKVTYITEEMFHRSEARVEFQTASKKEKQLDSLLREVKQLRKQYHNSVMPFIRDSLATRIQSLEYRNMVLNTETDQHYNEARHLEQEWWKEADERDYQSYEQNRDSLIRLMKISEVVPEAIPVSDTLRTDSVLTVVEAENEQPEKVEDTEVGITYKIQIGAYDNGIPSQRKVLFEKLEKIRTIETYMNDEGATVYTTGNIRNFSDAIKLQTQIRLEGIKDAFVIAIKDGKRVPLPLEK